MSLLEPKIEKKKCYWFMFLDLNLN